MKMLPLLTLTTLFSASTGMAEAVSTTAELVKAAREGAEGAMIEIAAGTYELSAPLEPKAGMKLIGAGMDKTILTHVASWKPSTQTLPDPEMKTQGMDTYAYLIRLQDKASSITISDLTLRGPQLHGAIYGWANQDLHLHHLRVQDVLWAGIRTFLMKGAKIHDCEFIDAGGRWQRGESGLKGGITGGAIFAIWMSDTEIAHNRFLRTQMGKADEFYGIKVRQGKRCRVQTTVTPRRDGLFGFNSKCDFQTIRIRNNIIECEGQPRPLLRNDPSYGALIENNTLVNVSDTNRYENPRTGAIRGLESPLKFECGVHGEVSVNGWETTQTSAAH